MMGVVLSASPPPPVFFSQRIIPSQSQFSLLRTQQQRPTTFISPSSSSYSSVVQQEEEESLPSTPHVDSADDVDDDPENSLPFSGCKACGRENIERGCNGEGRIQGGIVTIPGFGWWPIKAYRPCPGFVASGGNYRRRGQSMDQVVSGAAKSPSSMDNF